MFYNTEITPQIADSNYQRHIDSLALPQWFDRARTSLYRKCLESLDFKKHGLVVVKLETTYLKELRVDRDVTIRTWVSLIGTKSFETTQEAWQDNEKRAVEKTIFCAYNFREHKSEPLSDAIHDILERYA
ncbi:MAG: hotdog domain-containing protein [Planctomycetia bacterium]|nr:hotdog domain-containing protein [Planctomycetia bacterium]